MPDNTTLESPQACAEVGRVADRTRQLAVWKRTRAQWDGGEPELMDVRLHTPTPDVVIVRVSGAADGLHARLLAELAGKQLHRAPHVIVDLADVTVLGTGGLAALSTLHQQAVARGTELHIVAAKHGSVSRQLQATGVAQLVTFGSTADAVIAGLPRPSVATKLPAAAESSPRLWPQESHTFRCAGPRGA
ncbi:MAG: STAS domain-containing protein [Pseudonocardiaceae bacterium]